MIRKLAWFGVTAAMGLLAAGCVPQQTDDGVNTSPDVQALGNKKGGKPKGKVTLCHIPPGNPGNAHTITVDKSAVAAHLAHGDNLGKCQNDDDDDDDDGDDDDHHGGNHHGGHCGGGNGGAGGGTTSSTSTTGTGTGTGTGGAGGGNGGAGGGTTTSSTTDTGGAGGGTTTDTGGAGGGTTTDTGGAGGGTTTDTGGAGGGTTTSTVTDSGTTSTTTDSGTTSSINVCLADGLACANSAECCTGLCGGSGICVSTCSQVTPELGGDPCSPTVDCCEGACMGGLCWVGGTCKLQGASCDPTGQADACCFDMVCGADGTCQ